MLFKVVAILIVELFVLYLFPSSLPLGRDLKPESMEKEVNAHLPARVPYIFPAPGTNQIADSIRARRTNGTLLDLDGVLLNAEEIAGAWNSIGIALRNNNSLPGDMRELLILRCGVLNGAAYEWIQHEPVGRAAGLTTQQLLEIRQTPPLGPLPEDTTLTPVLSAALLYADYMTKEIKVPDDVFDGLKRYLNDRQVVEATVTVAGYNMVSRVLVALNVDGKMDTLVPVPS
ncbi:hypothetical protein NLI96_g2355 [Meripilus lineatus]|uniref:Carboxymuconolactone decarboxylase-like domain-containing protein n=1 Tax=Meripilus lineatus TaxID=2056292 RepID=A0AAD5YK20_9APHY|nr:hypothetical protein NLI96_g2355 [Physisporinus lineatus]